MQSRLFQFNFEQNLNVLPNICQFLLIKFISACVNLRKIVAQLAEQSLKTPEVRGSNPDVRKFL